MQKKKKKNFLGLDTNLCYESQHFWIVVNGRYNDLSTHQKKHCFTKCKKELLFFFSFSFLKNNLDDEHRVCAAFLHLNLKYSQLSLITCSTLTQD